MDDKHWEGLVRGDRCPLDAPRPVSSNEWDRVAELAVSSLYLAKNQTYRGQCVLVYDLRHVARLDQLAPDEWASFSSDLYAAHRAVVLTLRPDHVNVESLGNVVPHLHWHIVPRYRTDPRWGAPIWTSKLEDMATTHLPADERAALLAKLREHLPG